jgi:nitrate reductase delta subunit
VSGATEKTPERSAAGSRVKGWTRERFKLAQDAAISVSQLACSLPGCAPLETVVLFWIAEQAYRVKIFKPLEEVEAEDLPPGWFRDALAVGEGSDCGCC